MKLCSSHILTRFFKKKYKNRQASQRKILLKKLEQRSLIIQKLRSSKRKIRKRSKKRVKIGNRFFYLFPNSNFLGRLLGKIRTIGKSRAKVVSSKVGFNSRFSLVKTRPLRLNSIILREIGTNIQKNFLVDRLTGRFIKERINKKMKPGSLYNLRALRGLPVRGQRNKTNSRSARSYFKRFRLTTKKY